MGCARRLGGATCWVVTAGNRERYWPCDCDWSLHHLQRTTRIWSVTTFRGRGSTRWYKSQWHSRSRPRRCLLQVRKCLLPWLIHSFPVKTSISYYSALDRVHLCTMKASRFILYLGSQRSLSSKIFITYFKVIFSAQVIYVHCRKIRNQRLAKWKIMKTHRWPRDGFLSEYL